MTVKTQWVSALLGSCSYRKKEFEDQCRTRGMRNQRRQQVSYGGLLHLLSSEHFKGLSKNRAIKKLIYSVQATEHLMMRGHETWTVTHARRLNCLLLIQDIQQGLVWKCESGVWTWPHQQNIYGTFKEEKQ